MTIKSFIGTNLAFEKSFPHSKQLVHYKKITAAWESGNIAIGVFLDLKKAFDTVPYNI